MQTPVTTSPMKSAVLTSLPPITWLHGQSSVAEKVAAKRGELCCARSLPEEPLLFHLVLFAALCCALCAAPFGDCCSERLCPTCVPIRRKEEPSSSCPSLWRALSATTSSALLLSWQRRIKEVGGGAGCPSGVSCPAGRNSCSKVYFAPHSPRLAPSKARWQLRRTRGGCSSRVSIPPRSACWYCESPRGHKHHAEMHRVPCALRSRGDAGREARSREPRNAPEMKHPHPAWAATGSGRKV